MLNFNSSIPVCCPVPWRIDSFFMVQIASLAHLTHFPLWTALCNITDAPENLSPSSYNIVILNSMLDCIMFNITKAILNFSLYFTVSFSFFLSTSFLNLSLNWIHFGSCGEKVYWATHGSLNSSPHFHSPPPLSLTHWPCWPAAVVPNHPVNLAKIHVWKPRCPSFTFSFSVQAVMILSHCQKCAVTAWKSSKIFLSVVSDYGNGKNKKIHPGELMGWVLKNM